MAVAEHLRELADQGTGSFEFLAAGGARRERSRLAALARVRGELAAARRDATSARAAFEEALHVGDDSADALEAGVAQAAYGRFLRRRGERRAAVGRLGRAQEMFTALGAELYLPRCTRELAAYGVTPQIPADRAHLTPQESVVAELALAIHAGPGLTGAST